MWNLYQTAKTLYCKPSDHWQIKLLDADLTGFDDTIPGQGWWTCYQFDNAVTYFGNWIEGKLSEFTDKGKPKYTLEQLLAEDQVLRGTDAFNYLKQFFPVKQ